MPDTVCSGSYGPCNAVDSSSYAGTLGEGGWFGEYNGLVAGLVGEYIGEYIGLVGRHPDIIPNSSGKDAIIIPDCCQSPSFVDIIVPGIIISAGGMYAMTELATAAACLLLRK